MVPPVRVGVLVENGKLKRWQAWCLETLSERRNTRVILVMSNPVYPIVSNPQRSVMRRVWRAPRFLLGIPWLVVDQIDRFLARRDESSKAMEDVDAVSSLAGGQVIEVDPDSDATRDGQRFGEEDLRAIRSHELDILIHFGGTILRGPILSVAKHGVWFLYHSDTSVNRGMFPGFWEIAERAAVTGVTLQRLTEHVGNGQVLAHGWYPTDLTSWNRNHQRIAARGCTLLTDAVEYVVRRGEPPAVTESTVNVYCHSPHGKPGPSAAVATAVRTYARSCARKIKSALWRTQWHVRWGYADAADASISKLYPVVPPPDRLWADPFPATRDGRTWLFVEELFYATGRGRIVALEVDDEQVVDHRIVFEPSFHLSYPFLFEHEGDLYMIPESNENRSVVLWRCVQIPDQWERVHEILSDVSAADTTLVQHGDRYYLFMTVARNKTMDRSTELHIYYADSPLSRVWTPHVSNPVLVDCRTARMAGGFFRTPDGSLIRCAQVHGAHYGEAVALRRVEALTPEAYAEAPAGEIVPRWQPGLTGTHHFSARDGIVCVDASMSIPRWSRP